MKGEDGEVSVAEPAEEEGWGGREGETLHRQDRGRELILSDIFQSAFGEIDLEHLE